MKFWLGIDATELKQAWLLDEHRSIHAYFGGMLKNPEKWSRHSILGPMDPIVLHARHAELAKLMSIPHMTDVTDESVEAITTWRRERGLSELGMMLDSEGNPILKVEMRELQEKYIRRWMEAKYG